MAIETRYRDIVREIALDHYGYVTTKEATEAGVLAVELPKLATSLPKRYYVQASGRTFMETRCLPCSGWLM